MNALQNLTTHNKDEILMKNSWRYISPRYVNTQNYQQAFELREQNGIRETALSFFVNSSKDFNIEQCKQEIIPIIKNKLKAQNDARLIVIDLTNAMEEINLNGEILVSAKIDKFPHCSVIYENGSYDDENRRNEIIGIFYENIVGDFIVLKQSSGDFSLIDSRKK